VAPLQRRIELEFLGAFVKFQKATVSFFMSVRPSAHMVQLCYHCTALLPLYSSVITVQISMEFDVRVFFENVSRKFKFD
jgi:hypothetical protein